MAVTATFYTRGLDKILNKEVDWGSDTIKVALTTSSYTPDRDAHDFFNDITNEVVGAGYTAGGVTLGSKTQTQATHTFQFDAADAAWAGSTITARYAIIYDAQTAVAATSPLLAYVDFGTDQSSSAGAFTITWDATGVLVGTAS